MCCKLFCKIINNTYCILQHIMLIWIVINVKYLGTLYVFGNVKVFIQDQLCMMKMISILEKVRKELILIVRNFKIRRNYKIKKIIYKNYKFN